MKKQTAIFMLTLLLISLVSISFVQGKVGSDKQGTDIAPKGIMNKTPKLVTGNVSEWRVKTTQRIINKIGSAGEFMQGLSEKQTNIFLHLSRAQQKGILSMDNESALQAMKKFSLKLVNKSFMFKKRIIAANKLGEAKQNYAKAGQNYLKALNSYKDAKANFTEAKEKLRECKNVDSDDCNELRKRAQNHSTEMIINSANMIIEHLNKIKEKVDSSETMNETRAEEIISEIDGYTSELENAINKTKSAETKDEIKEAAKTVSKLWIKIRNRERLHAASVVNAREWGIIKRSEHLEKRLDQTLAKMEEHGINVTEINEKINEFSAKVNESKTKYELAQNLTDGAYLEENKENLKEMVDEAKQLINESHEALKEANRMLVEIVKDIKAAGGEIAPEEETEEEEYEVVEEEN